MNNTTRKDSNSLKSLIDAVVWPAIENKGYLTFIPKQNYFTVITKTEKAGGLLANSEIQKVLSLKNLRIQLSKLQETPKKSIETSCIYTKLNESFFQEANVLTGNLPGNKEMLLFKKYESNSVENKKGI